MSEPSSGFAGLTVARTHSIVLDSDADSVFPLFGPIREAEWAAGWDPEIVSGDALTPQRGCVFRTTHPARGETIWLLDRIDHSQRRIDYVRTTPKSDLAEIGIEVDTLPSERCRARITYRITGLSATGNRYVAEFTEERYRELIEEWAAAINHYLATGQQLPTQL